MKTIEYVDFFKPKVIGVDYQAVKSTDLKIEISSPLVFPLYIEDNSIINQDTLVQSMDDLSFGNISINSYTSFYPQEKIDGQNIDDFSLALIKYLLDSSTKCNFFVKQKTLHDFHGRFKFKSFSWPFV